MSVGLRIFNRAPESAACFEFKSFPPSPLHRQIRRRVQALKTLQGEHDELTQKFNDERRELELKYEKLYAPLYKQVGGGVLRPGVWCLWRGG